MRTWIARDYILLQCKGASKRICMFFGEKPVLKNGVFRNSKGRFIVPASPFRRLARGEVRTIKITEN